MNPLRGSCMSERSRCGAVRIGNFADEPFAGIVCVESLSLWRRASLQLRRQPSAEIVRVESLSLWRRAKLQLRPRTLCGDCACRVALAVAPCEFATSPTNPLQRLCVSNRSRCGAVRICNFAREPSAEIGRVESLSLWRRANLQLTVCGEIVRVELLSLWRRANWQLRRQTLCGDCACGIAPCGVATSPANPLRRLCVTDRSHCGTARFCLRSLLANGL